MPIKRKLRLAPVVAKLPAQARPKVKVRPLTTSTVSLVKREVKKELAKEAENKYIVRYTGGNAPTAAFSINPTPSATMNAMFINQGILTNADFYRLLPSIGQGVGTTERIGNVITPKYMKSSLQFALNGQTLDSMNLQVRVIAFTLKSVKSYEEFDTTSVDYATKLFWDGQSAQSIANIGGQPFYLHLPVNKREVNVVDDKTFTLGKGQGLSRRTQGLVSAGTELCVNAYEQYKEHDVVWSLPATFKYTESATVAVDTPTNFAPYIAVLYTQMDGQMSATGTANKNLVVMNIRTSLSYEDS